MRDSFYGEKVEYFNGKEWKKIKDYRKGEKILTYNTSDRTVDLLSPVKQHKKNTRWINNLKYGNLINVDLSDQAMLLGEYRRNQNLRSFTLEEAYNGGMFKFSDCAILNSFVYNGGNSLLTEERLMIIIRTIFEGDILEGNNCVVEKPAGEQLIFAGNLKRANVVFKKKANKDKTMYTFYYKLPRDKETILENTLNFTRKEISLMCDEIVYLSDKMKSIKIRNEDFIDFIQMILTLGGNRAIRKEDDSLYVQRNGKSVFGDLKILHLKNVKAKMQYSFTTQTGFFVVRSNGAIFIVGDFMN